MFFMDVPYIPAQEVPVLLAQTTNSALPVQPDYILKDCTETQIMGDPKAAWRVIDPVGMLTAYFENNLHRVLDRKAEAGIKINLLQGPEHGKLSAEVDNQGLTSYHYDPKSEYIGNDRATFAAEFEGKVYKIVVDIKVLIVIDINSSQCPAPKLIKVTKPSSGFNGYDINSITVNFANLAGGVVDHTVGNTPLPWTVTPSARKMKTEYYSGSDYQIEPASGK